MRGLSKMNDMIQFRLDRFERVEITPKGRSMRPFLKEGRNGVILTKPINPIRKYDVVLYKHNGVYVLHRVIKIEGDTLFICGDNSVVRETRTKNDIIGVAEKIIYRGKKIDSHNRILIFFVMLWYNAGIKKTVMFLKKVRRKIC